jgi:hypothetical protein
MLLVFAVKIALCFACADARANAWIGHKMEDLIRSWGPPTAMATLSDGTKIADWTYSRTGAGFGQKVGGTIITHRAQYECIARITADAAGTVTAAKVTGNLGGCNSLFRDKEAPA